MNGKSIKAFTISGDTQSPALPGVPSAEEAGIPGFNPSIWSAMYVPKGTPPEVVAKLATALDRALDDPMVTKRLVGLGGSVPSKAERGPAHLAKLLKAEIERWRPILKGAF